MKVLTVLGSVLGILVSMGTVVTVTVPALRNKIKKRLFLGDEFEKELSSVRCLLEQHITRDVELREELELQKAVDVCVLRDLITSIYFRRVKEKKIHSYELEDVSALYDLYRKRGGNSYVHAIYRQMTKEWELI